MKGTEEYILETLKESAARPFSHPPAPPRSRLKEARRNWGGGGPGAVEGAEGGGWGRGLGFDRHARGGAASKCTRPFSQADNPLTEPQNHHVPSLPAFDPGKR